MWIKQIVQSLKGNVPVIVFAKGVHGNWADLVYTGSQVLGVDWNVRLAEVRARLPESVGVQGNLDPVLLFAEWRELRSRAEEVLRRADGRPGHIFNLGHGILPETPVDNVKNLARFVQEYSVSESRNRQPGTGSPRS